jgi:hypothetical protein
MHLSTWGLTGDKQPGIRMNLKNRPRPGRQVCRTYFACSDFFEERVKTPA